MKSLIFQFILFGAALFATFGNAWAQATPNHVYQAVGVLEAYAESFRAADFNPAKPASRTATPAFKPRHVLFRAITLNNRVDLLRRLHGLSPGPEIVVGDELITPGHVARTVGLLQSSIAELASAYGLETAPETESLPSGMKPGDVYLRLSNVIRLVNGLHLPKTAPNDVYQMADTASVEARLLASSLGQGKSPPSIDRPATKSPKDVFQAVIDAAHDLQDLVQQRNEIAPSGGVAVPELPSGKVTPGDVARAVMLLLADLHEIRLKAGVTDTLRFSSMPTGKVPVDVGERIGVIRNLVSTLR